MEKKKKKTETLEAPPPKRKKKGSIWNCPFGQTIGEKGRTLGKP
jgi:hypothetical protein